MSRTTLFLLNPIGTPGDIHPHLAIGRELIGKGKDVMILTTPNYRALVEDNGIPFFPIGDSINLREVTDDKRLQQPYSAWKATLQWAAVGMMREVYSAIDSLHRPRETIVVSPPWSLGARVARERLQIFHASALLNPCIMRSCIDPPVLPMMPRSKWFPKWFRKLQYWIADRCVLDPIILGEVNRFRAEFGLPRISRVMNRWWLSPDLVLGLFSESLVPLCSDWPVHIELVGHTLWDPPALPNNSEKVHAFLDKNPGAIAVVLGSIRSGNDKLLATILGACLHLNKPVLVLTPFADHLPRALPESVHHCVYVPLADVLRKCDLIIHSACIGTASQGLSAGIPQIAFPQVNDQLDNAARLARLGVSKTISNKGISTLGLARAIREVLSCTEIEKNCLHVSTLHRNGSAGRIADLLTSNELNETLVSI